MRPIDADALVEMFKTQYECETCDNYDGVRCRACHCDDALGMIDSAPTLDAASVRRGEWKKEPYLLGWTHRCNRCGENYGMPHGMFNFCPNCGADMRKEEHHESED